MKILLFSAHPDDAEDGAGGFCARFAKEGHDVVIVHITREVEGKTYDGVPEREVRTAEAEASAALLGVRVRLLDYLMGEAPVDNESSRRIAEVIEEEEPRIVLTQWPIDTHPDHQVVGVLPIRHFIYSKSYDLGFYEVYAGIQSLSFAPNRWVDISDYIDIKEKAILEHRSQKPEVQVEMHHKMSTFRGLEIRREHAEAFHLLGNAKAFDELLGQEHTFGPSGGFHPVKGRQA